MDAFVISVFAFSLLGISLLFAIKSWEVRHGRVLAANFRHQADVRALELKARLMNGRQKTSKTFPFIILLGRYFIHEAALGFAASAHFAASQANHLADMVSHKHTFKRRATNSEFLKQMSEQPVTPVAIAKPTKARRVSKKKTAPENVETGD